MDYAVVYNTLQIPVLYYLVHNRKKMLLIGRESYEIEFHIAYKNYGVNYLLLSLRECTRLCFYKCKILDDIKAEAHSRRFCFVLFCLFSVVSQRGK